MRTRVVYHNNGSKTVVNGDVVDERAAMFTAASSDVYQMLDAMLDALNAAQGLHCNVNHEPIGDEPSVDTLADVRRQQALRLWAKLRHLPPAERSKYVRSLGLELPKEIQ